MKGPGVGLEGVRRSAPDRPRRAGLLAYCALVAAAAACGDDAPEPLQELGQLPEFSLVDQQGRAFTHADMAGHVWVADFMFTRCPTICPMLTERMKGLAATFAGESAVRFVSFSVDPANDTPERLSAYATGHGIDTERWTLVTGESLALKQTVVDGFHLAVGEPIEQTGGGYDILHSTRFVLIDQRGNLRGYFASDAEGMEALAVAIRRLLAAP